MKYEGKVLIACEESQAVTIEFRKLGIEAYSCDIQDCSGGHPEWHIKCDVLKELEKDWDMIIAFPPCTHLANSGAAYWEEKRINGIQGKAIDFFMSFAQAKCKRIAIENPAGIMSTYFRKPNQIINPFNFGTMERKLTCLWLKNLPELKYKYTDPPKPKHTIVRKSGDKKGQPYNYYWREGKSAKERSKTFPVIAKAMADQWSKVLIDGYYEGEPFKLNL